MTSGQTVVLTNVSGTFVSGEKITASDSSESDQIVEDSANGDLTISEVVTHDISQARSLFQDDDDAGQDFTADLVLTGNVVGSLLVDGTDSGGTNENANFVSKGSMVHQQLR